MELKWRIKPNTTKSQNSSFNIRRRRIGIIHVYLNFSAFRPAPIPVTLTNVVLGLNYDGLWILHHHSPRRLWLRRSSLDCTDSEAQQLKRRCISIKLFLEHFRHTHPSHQTLLQILTFELCKKFKIKLFGGCRISNGLLLSELLTNTRDKTSQR